MSSAEWLYFIRRVNLADSQSREFRQFKVQHTKKSMTIIYSIHTIDTCRWRCLMALPYKDKLLAKNLLVFIEKVTMIKI